MAGAFFVPAWGWVGSLDAYSNYRLNSIFVPEWGWVGSMKEFEIRTGLIFSSPLGDGLVPDSYQLMTTTGRGFSSPSGDGLVLV